jgi:hypothetical protein
MQDSILNAPTSGQTVTAPLPPVGEKRRIDFNRRRAIISRDRINVRPSRTAIIPPLAGFLIGAVCVGLIVIGVTSNALPYWLLALLLLVALLAVPLSGISLVYALVGANVIFDRAKESGAWQQGFLGMGIGTTELVPFWKIEAIVVREAGAVGEGAGRRTEEFAQWEAVLLKQSGKELTIAGMTVPRQFSRAGLASVLDLATALSALTGAPVRQDDPTPSEDKDEAVAGTPARASATASARRIRTSEKRPPAAPRRRRARRS